MAFSLARTSIAIKSDGSVATANTAITRSFPRLTRPIEVSFPTGEGQGGEDIVTASGIPGRIFGHNTSFNRQYVNDGDGWTLINSPTNAQWHFATAAGSLLYLGGSPDFSVRRVSYSGSWSDAIATLDGSNFTFTGEADQFRWEQSSIKQLPSGRIIFAEYGGSTNRKANRVYVSDDDGATWTHTATPATANSGVNHHCHGILLNEDTGRLYFLYGDAQNSSVFYSDDEGETLTAYTTPGKMSFQPMGGFYIGDNKFVCGHDDAHGLTIVDFSGGPGVNPTVVPAKVGWTRTVTTRYCWQRNLFSGVAIASFWDAGNVDRACISAANDPEGEWATIYRFPDDSQGLIDLFGPLTIDGVPYLFGLELLTAGSRRQFKMRVPSLSTATGTETHPAVTNSLSLGASSEGDLGQGNFWASYSADPGFVRAYASDYNHGSLSLVRTTRSDGGAMTVVSNQVAVNTSNVYYAMVRVKSPYPTFIAAQITLNDADQSDTKRFLGIGNSWEEIHLGPYTPASNGNARIHVLSSALSTPSGVNTELLIDSAGFYTTTGARSFQVGGTARTADILTETKARPASWRESLDVWPLIDSSQTSADHYLFTYKAGDSSASLYFDNSDAKFKLAVTKDGAAQTDVESAATWFLPGSHIAVEVDFSSGGTTFTLHDGSGTPMELEGTAVPDLLSASVTFTSGNSSGASVLPMTITRPATSTTGLGRARLSSLHIGL